MRPFDFVRSTTRCLMWQRQCACRRPPLEAKEAYQSPQEQHQQTATSPTERFRTPGLHTATFLHVRVCPYFALPHATCVRKQTQHVIHSRGAAVVDCAAAQRVCMCVSCVRSVGVPPITCGMHIVAHAMSTSHVHVPKKIRVLEYMLKNVPFLVWKVTYFLRLYV